MFLFTYLYGFNFYAPTRHFYPSDNFVYFSNMAAETHTIQITGVDLMVSHQSSFSDRLDHDMRAEFCAIKFRIEFGGVNI